MVNVIRRSELDKEGWYHVKQENCRFGDVWADKIKGGGEDDNVEDIVDQTWSVVS